MIGLSVLIIAYNAEKHIKDCLESVKWADEIVVVDAFSKDRTVEICKEYTDKVYQNKWPGYGPQRNFALSKCNFKWVLSVDADEIITPELQEEIKKAIEEDRYNAYAIPGLGFFLGRPLYHGGWYPNYHKRLFKRGMARWDSREVHEELVVDGKTGYLKNHFLHYNYDTIESFLERFNKYTSLSADEMRKTGIDRAGRKIHNIQKRGYFSTICFLLYHPLRWFGHRFFRLKGYKDGVHSLIYAILGAFYEFIARVKYWERSGEDTSAYHNKKVGKFLDFILRKSERVAGLVAEGIFLSINLITIIVLFLLLSPIVGIRRLIEKRY